MVELIYKNTINFIQNISKEKRKSIGQFFTPTSIARFMAKLAELKTESVKILDAGAGSGILTAALCQKCIEAKIVKDVYVDLYENNPDVFPILEQSMKAISSFMDQNGIGFKYRIINKNFIVDNSDFWHGIEARAEESLYDIVITNPPYKKIRKNDIESISMSDIVYGQPNIYFLFLAMSAKLLKENGQLISINPRSFTSGAYFKEFRKWFLNNVLITNIHLFDSREKVFKTEKILQETVIFKAIKTHQTHENLMITTSQDESFKNINCLTVSASTIIDYTSDNFYILIPTTYGDLQILELVRNWKYTLPDLHYRISTGKVVDFRATGFLSTDVSEDSVPLYWPCNFFDNKTTHPIDNKKCPQFILNTPKSKSLLINNDNYIFVKRFTAKEEARRIQCALCQKSDIKYKYIGVENHLNYITKINGTSSLDELYGLCTILNSTYMDKYYRILNGSTQVNATEMNSIPFPSLEIIRQIGSYSKTEKHLTVSFCDKMIYKFLIDKPNNYRDVAVI